MASLSLRPTTSSSVLRNSSSTPELTRESSAGERPNTSSLYFPPRYDVNGRKLPVGKGSGLGRLKKHTPLPDQLFPENWTKESNHCTKSELFSTRRIENATQLAKSQSALKIRSIDELTGSHQVAGLLCGKFYASDNTSQKTVTKLRQARRLEDLQRMQALASSWTRPEERAADEFDKHIDNVFRPCFALSQNNSPDDCAKEKPRPMTTAICGKRRQLNSPTLDIIRDRPPPPGLNWIEEPPTRKEIMDRKKVTMQLTKKTRNTQREVTQRPRGLSPFEHMESKEYNDFGKLTKKQFNVSSTTQLMIDRRQDIRKSLEAFGRATAEKKMDMYHSSLGQIERSQTPWWEIGREEAHHERVKATNQVIRSKRAARRHITTHPATSGEHRHKQKELRERRKATAMKITKQPACSREAYQSITRITKDRFTDLVIEFRNQTVQPVLDAGGKMLRMTPGEDAKLYSSFQKDGVFLEAEERKHVNAAAAELESTKKLGNKLPIRTFIVPSRSRSRTELYVSSGMKPCASLVGPKVQDVDALGVRTGGFQNIN